MIVREVERPSMRDVVGPAGNHARGELSAFDGDVLGGVQLVGSGKGAITLVLRYLTAKKIIADRNDEMIVADWIGTWVYNQMAPLIFPVKRFSERTKVIFVYHQYGFPQDMDSILAFAREKNLVVIEDCAHAIASYYKGRLLGSMGDFTIYSFSKWFFCFALGGVKSRQSDFGDYVRQAVLETSFGLTAMKDVAKLCYEWSTFSDSRVLKKYTHLFLTMSYSLYEEALKPGRRAEALLAQKLEYEVRSRQQRYRYFLEQMDHLGICDHLEREGITPYAIPIRCPESRNDHIVAALAERGIETGLHHFDVNRNLLSPAFERCVRIPCHSGISDGQFDEMIEAIKRNLHRGK